MIATHTTKNISITQQIIHNKKNQMWNPSCTQNCWCPASDEILLKLIGNRQIMHSKKMNPMRPWYSKNILRTRIWCNFAEPIWTNTPKNSLVDNQAQQKENLNRTIPYYIVCKPCTTTRYQMREPETKNECCKNRKTVILVPRLNILLLYWL